MITSVKFWLKNDTSPFARYCYASLKSLRSFSFPVIPVFHASLLKFHVAISNLLSTFMRVFYWTPLFKSQLTNPPAKLFLFSGMPLILGDLKMTLGEDCRVSGISTISARAAINGVKPSLEIGNNVDINWQNNIAVGSKIVIEDNVRLAGKVFLAGYPGHPLDVEDRAAGLPDTADQVGDIILRRDVWLATGVTVMAGVTIGEGTIVAAGSVVTKDLPANVIAAGMPAKVVRRL